MALDISLASIPDLSNKVVLITGGSLGIGKATVKLFLSKGAHVVNGDLYPGDIESNKYEYVKCDVSSWQSQLSLFKKTLELHGRIDVVIANAGTNESEQALQNKVDAAGDPIEPKWTTINVNLIGCLITVKLSLHYLQKQSTLDSLIITGSLASYDAYSMPVYVASKHGVLGLMRALRNHVKTWGLRINLVAPGITESNMTTKALERFKELNMYRQSPEEVSLAFGYLVSNEEVNGKTIYVNGGKYRELEDTYSVKLKSDVLGPDDFGPKTEDEFAAVVALLDTHW